MSTPASRPIEPLGPSSSGKGHQCPKPTVWEGQAVAEPLTAPHVHRPLGSQGQTKWTSRKLRTGLTGYTGSLVSRFQMAYFEFEVLQVNGLNRATGLTPEVVISSNKATVFLINSTEPHLSRIHLKHAIGEPRVNADLRPSSGSAARSHKRPAQTFAVIDNTQQIHSCPTEIFR